MKYKISKELFEEVMNEDIIEYRGVFGNIISGTYNNVTTLGNIKVVATNGGIVSCSVNDFFFKCISWARENGYQISSTSKYAQVNCLKTAKGLTSSGICETQQQAVFDVSEYILKRKENETHSMVRKDF